MGAPTELESVRRGLRHNLDRGVHQGPTRIVKRPATRDADAVASLRHELEVLHALDIDGAGRVHDIALIDGGVALVLDDAGDTTLARRARAGSLAVADFLEVATQLAEILERLHAARVIYRNVTPSNVVWDSKSRRATLIDFSMATTLSTLTVESSNPSEMKLDIRELMQEWLELEGYSVVSADAHIEEKKIRLGAAAALRKPLDFVRFLEVLSQVASGPARLTHPRGHR